MLNLGSYFIRSRYAVSEKDRPSRRRKRGNACQVRHSQDRTINAGCHKSLHMPTWGLTVESNAEGPLSISTNMSPQREDRRLFGGGRAAYTRNYGSSP